MNLSIWLALFSGVTQKGESSETFQSTTGIGKGISTKLWPIETTGESPVISATSWFLTIYVQKLSMSEM